MAVVVVAAGREACAGVVRKEKLKEAPRKSGRFITMPCLLLLLLGPGTALALAPALALRVRAVGPVMAHTAFAICAEGPTRISVPFAACWAHWATFALVGLVPTLGAEGVVGGAGGVIIGGITPGTLATGDTAIIRL